MRSALTLLCSLALPLTAAAQSPHDPARLFPREAAVSAPAGRPMRLPLPAEVLAETRGDLSDLRLHDAEGREVSYLVDSGARPSRDPVSFEMEPLSVRRRVQRGDSLIAEWEERLEVSTPGDAPPDSRWRLWIEAGAADFVRDVVVTRLDGEAPEELARATVFRLPAPVRERLWVDLPASVTGAARLEVKVTGEGGYLEPTLRFTASPGVVEPPVHRVPLEAIGVRAADGSTFLELERPGGLVPDRLVLRTETGSFHRRVRVHDVQQGRAAVEIAAADVFRVREIEGAEQLEIDLRRARGERLRVEIVDGDSPPLEGLEITAEVRAPALIFDPHAESLWLRFGGGRARAPRYDLQVLGGTRLGARLLEMADNLPVATLGPIRDNPRFDDGPALAFAMRPGRAPEAASFTHVAPVTVSGAREGLSRLRLPPSVLAAAREDLADLRVVGADGRQWPYLRSPSDTVDLVDATVEPGEADARASRYLLVPPAAPARANALVLHTDAPYLARDYVLWAHPSEGERFVIQRGRLERAPNDAAPIRVDFSDTRADRFELEILDGSDAPIAIDRVRLSLPSPTLFLAAPDGDYQLLAGDTRAEPPRYEIEDATDLLLSVRAADATVGAATTNPLHVEPEWWEGADAHTWILWAVLLLAVLVLGGLTLRLAAQPEPEPAGDGERAEEESEEEPEEPPAQEPPAGGEGGEPTAF